MRRDEEIVDACLALGVFLLLCLFYCCASRWRQINACCCQNLIDCLCCCCRKWGPERVQSYRDLEELLFDLDESRTGRLRYNDDEEDGDDGEEITVCSFFCDVLKKPQAQRPQIRTRQPRTDDDIEARDPNRGGSRFSEPLL